MPNLFTHLVGGGDAFIQGIAAKTYATSFSPWNPYVQSGKFVFADVLYQSFYIRPASSYLSIFPSTFGFNLFLLDHYALAGLFVHVYLGLASTHELLGVRRRPDLHVLRIHDRSQMS